MMPKHFFRHTCRELSEMEKEYQELAKKNKLRAKKIEKSLDSKFSAFNKNKEKRKRKFDVIRSNTQ